MSFDAFLTCFKDGELDGFELKLLQGAFGNSYELEYENDNHQSWRIEYPPPHGEDVIKTEIRNGKEVKILFHDTTHLGFSIEKNESIQHITINRPAHHESFYISIFSILVKTNTVIYSIAKHPPLVGRADTIPHLSMGIAEMFGNPVIVSEPLQIREFLGC